MKTKSFLIISLGFIILLIFSFIKAQSQTNDPPPIVVCAEESLEDCQIVHYYSDGSTKTITVPQRKDKPSGPVT